ncbi:shikimate dehydrogenase [Microvirga massiliensis]|uniref:shikimate dehydrogenase n=1 Tax=Microvirga massiliensis TaxID=1033741 RepID=UPI00062BCF70|nr:shikimate dehydrogenase [Microvirga massiliensis]
MKKAFVIGHPIAHSRSPLIHGYWLRKHGIPGSYERIDVPPEALRDFLATMRDRGFAGGNVTVPHKEAVFRLLGRVTDRAAQLQAVNTLWFEGDTLVGDNTDITGFMAHLDDSLGEGWDASTRTALVLGAGGAARAIVAGLAGRSLERIVVANRTLAKARELVEGMATPTGPTLEALDWDDLERALPKTDLLVNTTTLGMAGQPPLKLTLGRLPRHGIVCDIVYVPLETELLATARALGLRRVDGLGMLLHQAVPGFSHWFGVTPKVDPELRRLIEADIVGHR